MTSLGQIQLVFKNSTITSSFDLFQNTGEIDLANGTVVFMIPTNKILDIRKIYDSNTNVFYITSTQQNLTTVIYSGLFKMYDSASNINSLNSLANQNLAGANTQASIISDKNAANTGVAIVTRVATPNNVAASNISNIAVSNAAVSNAVSNAAVSASPNIAVSNIRNNNISSA